MLNPADRYCKKTMRLWGKEFAYDSNLCTNDGVYLTQHWCPRNRRF